MSSLAILIMKNLKLNLSAIGKGYGIDLIGKTLESLGLKII
jgi:thiamine biosynthesis lipoprotein ApbE